MDDYISYLNEVIPDKDCLKIVKSEAEKFRSSHSSSECHTIGMTLYQSDNFQIQEIGIFLLGYAAHEIPESLDFLRNTVSKHQNWKVQEFWLWLLTTIANPLAMKTQCLWLPAGLVIQIQMFAEQPQRDYGCGRAVRISRIIRPSLSVCCQTGKRIAVNMSENQSAMHWKTSARNILSLSLMKSTSGIFHQKR